MTYQKDYEWKKRRQSTRHKQSAFYWFILVMFVCYCVILVSFNYFSM